MFRSPALCCGLHTSLCHSSFSSSSLAWSSVLSALTLLMQRRKPDSSSPLPVEAAEPLRRSPPAAAPHQNRPSPILLRSPLHFSFLCLAPASHSPPRFLFYWRRWRRAPGPAAACGWSAGFCCAATGCSAGFACGATGRESSGPPR